MLKKLAIAGALLATFAGAHAQSAPFGVSGTVSPGPCNVVLTGGGIVDTGTVTLATAKTYRQVTNTTTAVALYGFPDRTIPITITCSAPTKVAVSFVDNKPAQRFSFNSGDGALYGLSDGLTGTAAIGFYSVAFNAITMDNTPVGQFLTAANGLTTTFSTTQPASLGVGPNSAVPGRTTGFAKTAGAAAPESFLSLTGGLTIQTYVSRDFIDKATNTVTPSGSGTLTLVYL